MEQNKFDATRMCIIDDKRFVDLNKLTENASALISSLIVLFKLFLPSFLWKKF